MSATIIDGKKISEQIREELAKKVNSFKLKTNRMPGLAVILVGNDPASKIYVANKIKGCEAVGIKSFSVQLPEDISEIDLARHIKLLNKDNNVDGILLQLPLPKHLNEAAITALIDNEKDVDGFSAKNLGNLLLGKECFISCTPKGIIELLKRSKIDIDGKNVVIVGRSNIVGKPLFHLLLQENATVTICHSHTNNIKCYTKKADIVVAAVGKAGFLKADMIKKDAVVIDVGINRNEDGKVVGDVAFDEVKEVASYITPVPGGVGPMTITMLLSNTVDSALKKLIN